jgi:hypothetical protein
MYLWNTPDVHAAYVATLQFYWAVGLRIFISPFFFSFFFLSVFISFVRNPLK